MMGTRKKGSRIKKAATKTALPKSTQSGGLIPNHPPPIEPQHPTFRMRTGGEERMRRDMGMHPDPSHSHQMKMRGEVEGIIDSFKAPLPQTKEEEAEVDIKLPATGLLHVHLLAHPNK